MYLFGTRRQNNFELLGSEFSETGSESTSEDLKNSRESLGGHALVTNGLSTFYYEIAQDNKPANLCTHKD